MSLYFFDFRDGEVITSDEEGTEVHTREKVRTTATKVLCEISDMVLPDGDHREFEVTVREEGGRVVYRAQLTFFGEWLP